MSAKNCKTVLSLSLIHSGHSFDILCIYFSHIFHLFIAVFAPFHSLSDTLYKQGFRIFHVCLWLFMWSGGSTLRKRHPTNTTKRCVIRSIFTSVFLRFRLQFSIDFRLLFRYCVACKSPTKH